MKDSVLSFSLVTHMNDILESWHTWMIICFVTYMNDIHEWHTLITVFCDIHEGQCFVTHMNDIHEWRHTWRTYMNDFRHIHEWHCDIWMTLWHTWTTFCGIHQCDIHDWHKWRTVFCLSLLWHTWMTYLNHDIHEWSCVLWHTWMTYMNDIHW